MKKKPEKIPVWWLYRSSAPTGPLPKTRYEQGTRELAGRSWIEIWVGREREVGEMEVVKREEINGFRDENKWTLEWKEMEATERRKKKMKDEGRPSGLWAAEKTKEGLDGK